MLSKLLNTCKRSVEFCKKERFSVRSSINKCKDKLIGFNSQTRDEKFREKAFEFVEQCFRVINDESAIELPIDVDNQKDLCLETLCFVHETRNYNIRAIMKELDKKAISYKMDSVIIVLINYLYYLYVGKFEKLFLYWNRETKEHLKKMIDVIESYCEE